MKEKGTSVVFMQHDIAVMVHALGKAALFEFENWRYIKNQKRDELDEFVYRMEKNIRLYEVTYTQLVRKLCRELSKRQGGIYRRATDDLRKSTVRIIHQSADEVIESMKKTACSMKEQAETK